MPIPTPITHHGLTLHGVPAFDDNYLWLLCNDRDAIAVDPGDASPIRSALRDLDRRLAAILVTHHHGDHIGGADELARAFDCPVFGPDDARIAAVTHPCDEGDVLHVPGFPDIAVWAVPGHTRSHLAFHLAPWMFVGDTLFGGGCGRVFDGDVASLFASLQRIAALPADTWICCAHEYTRANLRFALHVEPGHAATQARLAALDDGCASVPFRLGDEHASNIFLRCHEPAVRAAVHAQAGITHDDPCTVFAALRQWKNRHG